MIDLSPQSHDESTAPAKLRPAPRHDARPDTDGNRRRRGGRRMMIHERAEAAIQLISRWAGPATLMAVAAVMGWYFFA